MTFFSELASEPWRFDLFAALRRLERDNPAKPRIGDAARLADEFVRLYQNPFFEFPDANIEAVSFDRANRTRLAVRFLGLFGPQGALPLTTSDEAYGWLLKRDDAFIRFAGIFQSRFLALFFRAWADARPIAQNDRPDEDRFGAYIGAVIGIGTRALKDADSIPDFAKLPFAGLIAGRAKSASRLRSFLSGYLRTRVDVEEFVGLWLPLDRADRARLGAANSRLGEDCIAGASAFSVSDKFRLRVFVRDLAHFRQFLPGAPLAREIADAVYLYLGEEYDWDMELAIGAGQAAPARLAASGPGMQGAQLGWTSWMSPNWAKTDETIRTDAHFHIVSRLSR